MFFSNDKLDVLKARVAQLEAQNSRYREALEFYADELTWVKGGHKYRDADDVTVFGVSESTMIDEDRGRRARLALEEDTTEFSG